MSQSIVLIAERSVTFDELRLKCGCHFGSDFTSADRLVVQSGNKYVAFNEGVNDYEDWELEKLPISNPRFYWVKFRPLDFLKEVLPFLVNDPRIWVDNNYGHILPGPEVVNRLRQEPDWGTCIFD